MMVAGQICVFWSLIGRLPPLPLLLLLLYLLPLLFLLLYLAQTQPKVKGGRQTSTCTCWGREGGKWDEG
jgi:hypothetical protein